MDTGFRSGSVSDSFPASRLGQAIEPPREQRIMENHLHAARNLVEVAAGIIGSVDELRGRLLGLSEPQGPATAQKEPQLVRAEMAELGVLLERLNTQMQMISQKVGDLHRI